MAKAITKIKNATLEQVMRALGDPIRISVVRQLLSADGEKACGTFDHEITKATFSHHLNILEEAGIILRRQEGARKMVSLRLAELQKSFPGLLKLITNSK